MEKDLPPAPYRKCCARRLSMEVAGKAGIERIADGGGRQVSDVDDVAASQVSGDFGAQASEMRRGTIALFSQSAPNRLSAGSRANKGKITVAGDVDRVYPGATSNQKLAPEKIGFTAASGPKV